MTTRKVALCADDYALNDGVSRGILALVDSRRLSAVSVMSANPGWRDFARDIVARRERVAIGLHLDLTSTPFQRVTSAVSLDAVIVGSLLRRIDLPALTAEFERQFDSFEAETGFIPDHVDGHHHVHAFPRVRDALLAVLRRRFGALPSRQRPLVRDPTDAIGRILARRASTMKALVVASLACGFGRRLDRSGFPRNRGFSGFSSFGRGTPFDQELDRFLLAPGPRHLVMCHPGLVEAGSETPDPLSARRQDEYDALSARADVGDRLLRINRRDGETSTAFADWLQA